MNDTHNDFHHCPGPNLEFMGRVLMFRKRARQCPMHVSQMRAHYSWGGGWGAVNLKISCYVLRCHQWSGSGKKTAKKGTNIQSEDTSTFYRRISIIVKLGLNPAPLIPTYLYDMKQAFIKQHFRWYSSL